ncbi:hypothetical protein [Streptomyces sp. NPDC001978]|uniref:hypothetical protein n=1 Tax=Streptomyces sp. NPDC001978 TaxID=3364627 RepID=UPI003684DEFD
MRELLDKIETRRQLVRETVERLREQITLLGEQLAAAERTLERLEITRETCAARKVIVANGHSDGSSAGSMFE